MSKLLIVEDERHLADGLRFNLEAEGHAVTVAEDGETALRQLLEEKLAPDAIVLDVMLPGIDGFEVARELRGKHDYTPILMLTARNRPEDVLRGFECGADDYLAKPFELAILLARVHGLLRRSSWDIRRSSRGPLGSGAVKENASAASGKKAGSVAKAGEPAEAAHPRTPRQPEASFEFAGKLLDFSTLELRTGSNVYHLTAMEMELLRFLVMHEGAIVSRKNILEQVWGLHEDTDTRAIDNFIVRLRKYIEADPSQPKHLLTVRGVGYRFIR